MDESATATLSRPSEPATAPAPTPKLTRIWREYVTDLRDDVNARAETTPVTDRRAVAVLVTAALALTAANSWGQRSTEFHGLARWALVNIGCYVLPAVFVIRVVLRERVRDFGLRVEGMAAHRGLYLTLLSLALPFVVLASFSHGFQHKYPFLHLDPGQSLWPQMFAWWALYWCQFVALEFFFRGFLVHGLAPRLGWISIVVMVVPYNMLHYGKPMPEALAAIVGGLVLGTLSLKTRSIWWGAALHIAIAITMDLCALGHAGRLF
jgi:membrane protease YdiL (CAAX protease family)